MNAETLYEQYVQKLENALANDDAEALDYILEYAMSGNLEEDDIDDISDIIDEATLYLELKEDQYKEMALNMIEEFKETIKK